jgi:serine/threonine-protein kinase
VISHVDFPKPFGPYVLIRPLGSGAMGEVCLARPYDSERGLPSLVVIKRLHAELGEQRTFVERFVHEARIAVSVDSPHVAKLYDAGRVANLLYIAVEYIPGWTLAELIEASINARQELALEGLAELVVGALRGLEALHGASDASGNQLDIVHRDLSPRNLMLGEDGLVRIIDFGLGKSKQQVWKTRTGVVLGSPGYMSPEQALGQSLDQRADLYAIGVILWELITRRHYFPRDGIPAMLTAAAAPVFVLPSSYRPSVPGRLDGVLERALAPHPEDRFQTAGAFREALEAAVPRVQGSRAAAAVVDLLFGSKKQLRHAQQQHDLSMTIPDGADQEPTVYASSSSLVQRAGVGPLRMDLLRNRSAPKGSTTLDESVPPLDTPVATVTVPTVPPAPDQTAIRPTVSPGATTSPPRVERAMVSGARAPAPNRAPAAVAIGLASVALVGAGIVVDRFLLVPAQPGAQSAAPVALPAPRGPTVIPSAASAPPVDPPAPAAAPAPAPAAPAAPLGEREREHERERDHAEGRPTRRPQRPAPAPAVPGSSAREEPAPAAPTPATIKETLQDLTVRAVKLKSRLGPDSQNAREVDDLLNRLNLESFRADPDKSGPELSSIAQKLAALERAR